MGGAVIFHHTCSEKAFDQLHVPTYGFVLSGLPALQLSLAKIRSRRQEQLILVLGINLGTDSRLRKVHAQAH
jgi:hypothetical protein